MNGCVETSDCEGQTVYCNRVTNRCNSCYIICDQRNQLGVECMNYCPDMFLKTQQLHTDLPTTATRQVILEQAMPDKKLSVDMNNQIFLLIIICICFIVLVVVIIIAFILMYIRLRHTKSPSSFPKKTLFGQTENGKMKPGHNKACDTSLNLNEKASHAHQNESESESSRISRTDPLHSLGKCAVKSPRDSLCNRSETTASADDVMQPHETENDTSVCRMKCGGNREEESKITDIHRSHEYAQACRPTVPQCLHNLPPQEIETDDVRLEIEEFYGVHHKIDEVASCSNGNTTAYKDVSLLDAQTDEQVDPEDVKLLSQLLHVSSSQVLQKEELLNSVRVRKYSDSQSNTEFSEETLLKEHDSSEDLHPVDSVPVKSVEPVEEKPVLPHPNNRIYDELNKIGWVQSVYSEGESIYIDLDFNDISEEMAVQELIWRTRCGPKKFHLRHRECIL